MVLQTEKNKRARILDKAVKELSDAMWRKKKQEKLDSVDAGLTMAASEISEKPIKHVDAASVTSLSGVYNTAYNQLAAEKVRDFIELPPTVKILPPYMKDVLKAEGDEYRQHYEGMDKFTQQHYKTLQEDGVRSWVGMEGSLTTASIYSASSRGYGPEILAQSYDEFSVARANRCMSSGISTAASSRVGSLLQSRSSANSISQGGGSLSMSMSMSGSYSHSRGGRPRSRSNSPQSANGRSHGGSTKSKKHNVNRNGSNGQIRLAPLDTASTASAGGGGAGVGTAGAAVVVASARSTGSRRGGGGVGSSAASVESSVRGSSNLRIGERQLDAGSAVGGDGGLDETSSYQDVSVMSADSQLMGMGIGGRSGGLGLDDGGSLSSPTSLLSLSMSMSMSALGGFGAEGSSTLAGGEASQQGQLQQRNLLDPVFYKEQARNTFGRKHAVGKLRRAEVTWGMLAYKDPRRNAGEDGDTDEDDYDTSSKTSVSRRGIAAGSSVSSSQRKMAGSQASKYLTKEQAAIAAMKTTSTVKTRSLTVYHPNMHTFQDASILPKKVE